MKAYKGYLYAILSAVIYGCMPLMAKYIYDDGVSPMTLVLLRNALALPVLAVLAYRQSKSLKIPAGALPSLGICSLMGCCVTPILLFSSYRFIASGTATVFHFIYPAVVVLAGMLLLGKKVSWANLFCVLLCVLGIALFYTPGEPLDWRGSALALLSGVTYSVYVLALSGFRYRQVSGFVFCFYVALIASVLMLVICIASGQLCLPKSILGWALCALFAVSITAGAVALFQRGTFLIGGERTSILSTLEPTTSVFVGVLVFHEPLGLRVLLGSVLVIAASVLIAVFDMREKKKELRR